MKKITLLLLLVFGYTETHAFESYKECGSSGENNIELRRGNTEAFRCFLTDQIYWDYDSMRVANKYLLRNPEELLIVFGQKDVKQELIDRFLEYVDDSSISYKEKIEIYRSRLRALESVSKYDSTPFTRSLNLSIQEYEYVTCREKNKKDCENEYSRMIRH